MSIYLCAKSKRPSLSVTQKNRKECQVANKLKNCSILTLGLSACTILDDLIDKPSGLRQINLESLFRCQTSKAFPFLHVPSPLILSSHKGHLFPLLVDELTPILIPNLHIHMNLLPLETEENKKRRRYFYNFCASMAVGEAVTCPICANNISQLIQPCKTKYSEHALIVFA